MACCRCVAAGPFRQGTAEDTFSAARPAAPVCWRAGGTHRWLPRQAIFPLAEKGWFVDNEIVRSYGLKKGTILNQELSVLHCQHGRPISNSPHLHKEWSKTRQHIQVWYCAGLCRDSILCLSCFTVESQGNEAGTITVYSHTGSFPSWENAVESEDVIMQKALGKQWFCQTELCYCYWQGSFKSTNVLHVLDD